MGFTRFNAGLLIKLKKAPRQIAQRILSEVQIALTERAVNAIDNSAPITLVSATLGHADLKTISVYAHARPGESSGRYLKTKS